MNDSKNYIIPDDLKGVHIHFVGIKGTGMAALVEIMFHKGAIISGSDVSDRFYTDEILEKLNITPLPFSQLNISDQIDFVIYSSAYKLDVNPDLIAAQKKNIPCLLYTQALGQYSSKAYSCGVCGVHGKTSTTGLVGSILMQLPLPSQVLVGSMINSFGNSCTFTSDLFKEQIKLKKTTNNQFFIAETCEYQRHFMSFVPQKIILTSVESDHQDYYPTYEDIRNAFVDYALKLPKNGDLIYCADDKGACDVVRIVKEKRGDINFIDYGYNAKGDFKILYEKVENEKNNFKIQCFDQQLSLSIPGKHEVLDAVAAIALCCQLLNVCGMNHLDFIEEIKKGLINFTGGKRRTEKVGEITTKNGNNVIIIDDYAHHPTAVKTTLAGYREFYKTRKIVVDFMSHTYSRTKALLEEFSKCFSDADELILHKIYSSARENPSDFDIDGKTLYEYVKKHFNNVYYFEEPLDSLPYLKDLFMHELPAEYCDGYVFVTMGAGDNWKIGKELLK